MAFPKIRIKLLKSTIGTPLKIKKVVFSLGLKRPNSEVVHESSPCIIGMISKVKHLVNVSDIEGESSK